MISFHYDEHDFDINSTLIQNLLAILERLSIEMEPACFTKLSEKQFNKLNKTRHDFVHSPAYRNKVDEPTVKDYWECFHDYVKLSLLEQAPVPANIANHLSTIILKSAYNFTTFIVFCETIAEIVNCHENSQPLTEEHENILMENKLESVEVLKDSNVVKNAKQVLDLVKGSTKNEDYQSMIREIKELFPKGTESNQDEANPESFKFMDLPLELKKEA